MDALLFIKIIIPVFFAILFLQSGLDKIFDWSGNVSFHKEHFANSPLQRWTVINLAFIAGLEIICGLLAVAGVLGLFINNNNSFAMYSVELAALIFTMLFFGQRISKDYKGAVTIANYFALDLIAFIILYWLH